MNPMATLTITPLGPDDLDWVSAMEMECGDVGWSRTQFVRELSLPISHFLVMREGVNILGYGGYWTVASEAQITNLVILPHERRQGKGLMLLEHLMTEARHSGCRRMTLEVRSQNQAAQALYAKAGFVRQTIRCAVYSNPLDDAVLMEKILWITWQKANPS